MRRVRGLIAVLVWFGLAAAVLGEQPGADDFLSPVQGGPTDVKAPDKVKVEGKVVQAASAQDALNAAVEQNKKDLKTADTPEMGVKMAKFPSGLGFVATGMATYRTMENPTATRIAQRKAYLIAFVQAEKNLAQALNGLDNEGKNTVREALENVNLPKEEMTNISTKSEESLRQAVDMMLRGFVIYEVNDDPKQRLVTVSIVTTPKTRGKLARPAPNVVEVDTLREGVNQVLQEVRAGVVPPIGGRIITMRATGETAFVGFGSAVVGSSENAAVQAKLNLAAQKIASSRSLDSLCGLILGDQAQWQGEVGDAHKDEVHEFETLKADDPLAKDNPAGVRKLEKARQTFVARIQTTDDYNTVRKGTIPPGVASRTWFDDDHAWAYSMSVYAPSLTQAAADAAREMKESRIVQPIRGGTGDTKPGRETSSGFTDEKDPNVKRPDKTVKPGPGGKVGTDDDK